jgi:CubicO group peptidase (beta-lactamase class C family)
VTVEGQVGKICEAAIREHVFPGCVAGYVRDGETTVLPFGGQTYEPIAEAVTAKTVYDVASITKSIPTSCLMLHLVERGLVSLDDKVVLYIPELANEYREQILVRHLLTYTVIFDLPQGLSGVAKEFPNQILENVFTAPLAAVPGTKYLYTSAPALLAGLIIERIAKMPLNDFANQVFGPLPMRRTAFSTGWVEPHTVAPSEIDDRGLVRGVPHDEAAWALRGTGRIAGHAGLFTTAPDLLVFANMLLNEGEYDGARYFDPKTVNMMHTNQLPADLHATGLGWEMARPEVMGTHGSKQLFGKTGFTGCIVLIDPEKQRALVFVSNRTYPQRPSTREPINKVFRELADLVLA